MPTVALGCCCAEELPPVCEACPLPATIYLWFREEVQPPTFPPTFATEGPIAATYNGSLDAWVNSSGLLQYVTGYAEGAPCSGSTSTLKLNTWYGIKASDEDCKIQIVGVIRACYTGSFSLYRAIGSSAPPAWIATGAGLPLDFPDDTATDPQTDGWSQIFGIEGAVSCDNVLYQAGTGASGFKITRTTTPPTGF